MWSRKQMMQACIITTAVIGAVVGAQHMLSNSHLLRADNAIMQVMNRAANNITYRRPQIFRVGGPNALWQVPSAPDFFTSWAASVRFRLGDVLHIVGGTSGYKLYSVSYSSYTVCNITYAYDWDMRWDLNYTYADNNSTSNNLYIQLHSSTKTYYFIQGDDPISCTKGLKFAPTMNSIDIPTAPIRPSVNTHTRQPQVFEVGGDSATWTIPSKANFYEDWASNVSFIVGDVLSFTLSSIYYEVNNVPYTEYELCRSYSWYWNTSITGVYQFTKPGVEYFKAYHPQYCIQGMRFIANVYEIGSTDAPIPSPTFPPLVATPPPMITPSPMTMPPPKTSPPPLIIPPSSPSNPPKDLPPTSSPNNSPADPPSPLPPTILVPSTSENKSKNIILIVEIIAGLIGGILGLATLAKFTIVLCRRCNINIDSNVTNIYHQGQ